MRYRMRLLCCCLGLLLAASAQAHLNEHRIGIFSQMGKQSSLDTWQRIAEHLEREIPGHHFEPVLLTVDEINTQLDLDSLDFVFTNPVHYVTLRASNRFSGAIATLYRRTNLGEIGALGGVVLTRRDSDLKTLSDLPGQTIGVLGDSFLGGYAAILMELHGRGIEADDMTFVKSGDNHFDTVDGLLAGRFQVGWVRTGIIEAYRQRYPLEADQLRVLEPYYFPTYPYQLSTRLYPEWPMVAVSRVDQVLSRQVTAALLRLGGSPDADSLGFGFTIPADYSPVEQMMRSLGLPPFHQTADLSVRELWHLYRWPIVVLVLFVAGSLVTLGVISWGLRVAAQKDRKLAQRSAEVAAAQARLQSIIDAMPDPVWVRQRDGQVIYGNARFYQLMAELTHEQQELIHQCRVEQRQQVVNLTFELSHARQEWEIHAACQWIHGERVELFSARDVTADRRSRRALRVFERVFDSALDGIVITDQHARILRINPAFSTITGYHPEEVVGQTPKVLQSGEMSADFYQQMWQNLRENKRWRGEIVNRKKNGELYREILSVVSIEADRQEDPEGGDHFVGTFTDITELRQQQEQLERLALYDPLTGMPNRRLFGDRLEHAIEVANREKRRLAICFLDLDGFKLINEQFGHEQGDYFLRSIGARIVQSARGVDTCGRFGGDEFALLIDGFSSRNEVFETLSRLISAVTQPVTLSNGVDASVGMSIGVALYPEDGHETRQLISKADGALYIAKRQGGQQVRFAEGGDGLATHTEISHALCQAMAEDQFFMVYQPKLDLRNGSVYGFEALIRWNKPGVGMVPPNDFLHEVAIAMLSKELDRWVIEHVVRQLGLWHQQGHHWQVGLNLSAGSLVDPELITWLTQACRQYRVASEYLELEILESALIDNIDLAISNINSLRRAGFRVALDDFGTGYSSLDYFRRLPVDVIKIDCSFVQQMLQNPNDMAVVESLIHLARVFGREVVAEGVESFEHCQPLLDFGCHQVQGYAFSRPLTLEQLPDWLETWPAKQLRWQPQESTQHVLNAAATALRCWGDQVLEAVASRDTELLARHRPADGVFSQWLHTYGASMFSHSPCYSLVVDLDATLHRQLERLQTLICSDDASTQDLARVQSGFTTTIDTLQTLITSIKRFSSTWEGALRPTEEDARLSPAGCDDVEAKRLLDRLK